MKSLKQITHKKPSIAVTAMIEGLDNIPNGFQLAMTTFGNSDGGVCFVCAATLALMRISGHIFSPDEVTWTENRAKIAGYGKEEVENFENAMDDFRCGFRSTLGVFCGIRKMPEPDDQLCRVGNLNWELVRVDYVAYRDLLVAKGL